MSGRGGYAGLPGPGALVPPPRRSSLGRPRRIRGLLLFVLLLSLGFLLWLALKKDVSLEELRRAAEDRSSELLASLSARVMNGDGRGRSMRGLTQAEIEKLADASWLASELEGAAPARDGMNASTPLRRPRPQTKPEQLIDVGIRPTTFVPDSAEFDWAAIAVKTGAATAHKRVPVQAATFLRHVRNWILIGESSGIVVGERPVIDVLTTLYTNPPEPDHIGAHAGHGSNSSFFKSPKMPVADPMSLSTGTRPAARRLLRRHSDEHSNKPDAIIPDNSAEGWKKDAHKNLPGFVHLWNHFPNADWYFMIDDDTYLFLSNIAQAVRGLNPEKAYYFGTPTLFIGCDGVTKYGDGPQFAHGGSGIMMSRGALIRMLGIVDRCITRYSDCWAGDVRTALCLRDTGIKLQGHRELNFHNEPPNSRSWWPEDPCSRPTTFHHLLVKQMQKLYDVDRVQLERGEVTTYGHVFSEFLMDSERKELATRVDRDINRQGMDYRHQSTPSPEACANLCNEEARCKAWTWERNEGGADGECWLKKGIPGKQEKKGATSGVVPKNYYC